MILTNARILTFDADRRVLDSGTVEVHKDGSVGAVKAGRSHSRNAIDLEGRLLMPALINCHTHLYSTLARGLQLPGAAPRNFTQILQKVWWRLDRALNEEDVYFSALVGLIDSAHCGVGTLLDHHSSPNACAGSLDHIERAFLEVGLRGATCYETTDRNGRSGMQAGVQENLRFIQSRKPDSQVAAMFGLHASFTLSDRTLSACSEANQGTNAGFHVHVAEDITDLGAVRRLCRFGILDDRTLAAHCIHITPAERTQLARRQVNVALNPQSNCNNAVGTPDLLGLFRSGVRVGLGSDGYSPRMWDEFKTVQNLQKLRSRNPRVGAAEAYAAAFVNNRAIARTVLGVDIGRIERGAKADLVVIDYHPPTVLDTSNVLGHLLFGVSNSPVDSLMVNGQWVLRAGHCVRVDERRIAEQSAKRAASLWKLAGQQGAL